MSRDERFSSAAGSHPSAFKENRKEGRGALSSPARRNYIYLESFGDICGVRNKDPQSAGVFMCEYTEENYI